MQGDTPLHAAAQNAGAGLVKLLLDEGCNPLVENLLVSHAARVVSIPFASFPGIQHTCTDAVCGSFGKQDSGSLCGPYTCFLCQCQLIASL